MVYTQTPHLTQGDVEAVLREAGGPITVKQIGAVLELDMIPRRIQDISNRCSYAVEKSLATRVDKGTYLWISDNTDKEKSMETFTAEAATTNGEVEVICKQCGYVAKSDMGLKMHASRSHKKPPTADEAFELTGKALDVLFPDGFPASRLIELAELQKHMLKVVR